MFHKNNWTTTRIIAVALLCLGLARGAYGYIDLAPTLSKIINDSQKVALVEVVEYNRQTHELVLKEVRAMKGELSTEQIHHDVASTEGSIVPRQVLQWAAPGARAVMFAGRGTSLICFGDGWYQVRASSTGPAKLGKDRPDLPLAYYGSLSRLDESVQAMIAGGDAILTVVAHGAEDEAASFDLALNRPALPELVRIQRIRANLAMPGTAMSAATPAYLLGIGPVDEADLPELLEKLKSPEAIVRADAADDLRRLGRPARTAEASLTALLKDPTPHVRFSAAAALLRIRPKNTSGIEPLSVGLESKNLGERRDAIKYAGLAGAAAAPLTPKLASLLKDSDEATRITALQSISLLGPAASSATEAVIPLLDNPDVAIDAADALGRIGVAARPAMPRLTKMLSSQQPEVAWAAERAMAQIGGPDAHPAVDFIITHLNAGNATEVEGYNMMVYLALLGPIATDAIPTIQAVRVKHPVLPSATQWAINADRGLPWQNAPAAGGGRGLSSATSGIGLLIYQSFVRELGDRLSPTSKLLAQKIMDGTAGDVPNWGYDILIAAPDVSVSTLSPHLADADIVMRERATVALAMMGPSAASAKDAVTTAMNRASSEREKRLLKWCLKEITQD